MTPLIFSAKMEDTEYNRVLGLMVGRAQKETKEINKSLNEIGHGGGGKGGGLRDFTAGIRDLSEGRTSFAMVRLTESIGLSGLALAGIVGGIAVATIAWEKYSEEVKQTREESDKLSASFSKLSTESARHGLPEEAHTSEDKTISELKEKIKQEEDLQEKLYDQRHGMHGLFKTVGEFVTLKPFTGNAFEGQDQEKESRLREENSARQIKQLGQDEKNDAGRVEGHANRLKREAEDEKEYTDLVLQEFDKRYNAQKEDEKETTDIILQEFERRHKEIEDGEKETTDIILQEFDRRYKMQGDDDREYTEIVNQEFERRYKALEDYKTQEMTLYKETAKQNIQTLEAEAAQAARVSDAAQNKLSAFNRLTPDERRNANRADAAEAREHGREGRIGGNVTDTRSGSRKRAMEAFEAARDAALAKQRVVTAKTALDDATIKALAAAIAKENNVLIMAP